MELSKKKCVPCEGGVPPLSQEEQKKLLDQIPSWSVTNGRVAKEFKFKNFKEAMDFVNKVASIAEQEGHHPDIAISYNKVRLEIWTHAINGLSENDFILAAKIDDLN